MHQSLEKFVRSHYRDMQGYVSAGMDSNKSNEKVFMNANENHFVLPELEGLNFYPEPQPKELLEAMAETYGVKPDQVAATRGADEALALLSSTFCEPHQDSIVIHTPTFGVYGVNADGAPVTKHVVPLKKSDDGFELDKEAIIAVACDPEKNVKLVFLCSPNNPTGGSFPKEDILEIINAVEGHAVVVLDEAYAEFSTMAGYVDELEKHPNLIILRTLSKAYALAGIRMGAMLCADADFIKLIQSKVLDVYPLPRPSIKAALIALDPSNRIQVQGNIQKMLQERDRMARRLKSSDFIRCVYPSDANFLLVECADAKGFVKYCQDHSFYIRDFSSAPGAENCFRISPALPEQNDRFFELLDSYTKKAA